MIRRNNFDKTASSWADYIFLLFLCSIFTLFMFGLAHFNEEIRQEEVVGLKLDLLIKSLSK